MDYSKPTFLLGLSFLTILFLIPNTTAAMYILGSEQLVQADGADLEVPGYSVPQFVDWNNDALPDLVVGQGGGGITPAKVVVFLNSGTIAAPVFSTGFFAQAGGRDLSLPASGCLGLFPRVLYYNGDSLKDLLVGSALGDIIIYLNVGTDESPVFDSGTALATNGLIQDVIDVGARATPIFQDWDEDGRRDLISGALDGMVHIFLNTGTDTEPLFAPEMIVQESGGNLVVPGGRSSPVICDFNLDGTKDLIAGNTAGQLVFYANEGSNSAPVFFGSVLLKSAMVPIDLDGSPRSRPSVGDWTGDGLLDVLVGCADGKIHLFQSEGLSPVSDIPFAATVLESPWPNPFNPQVNIEFNLRHSSKIELGIFDVHGRRIAQLANGDFPSGPTQLVWNGTNDTGQAMPSGMYLVHLDSGPIQSQRKIMLVR